MKKEFGLFIIALFLIGSIGIAFAEELEETGGGPIQYGECGDDICDSGENTSTYPYYCPQDCDGIENENESEDEIVFCTMDAKMCPDGSYVGRDPENNCEFYDCPSEDEEQNSCNNLYWIDNTNKNCSQKEFCGAYMYYGLYTFDAKEECLDFLEKEQEDEEDDNETEEYGEQEKRLGSSCGTVTPGTQNECCINKGYKGWDEEEFKFIGEENRDRIRERIKFGNENPTECPKECTCSGQTVKCSFENGTRVMTIYAGNSGNVIVQVKNINASTNVTLYKEDGKIYGTFRDNETKEIRLPDEVMEKLKEKKGKRLQLQNESIELTGDGYYKVEMKKRSRLFLIIPVKESVNAEIDAETGETIKVRNPWWGFLAKDIKEDLTEETED